MDQTKNLLSTITIVLVVAVLTFTRFHYLKKDNPVVAPVLTWDAFGYYLYLPGIFIYNDIKKLDWIPAIQEKYQSTGSLYQVSSLENGNKVMKYLGGIAIMYSPFFAIGHVAAGILNYPQDGFSAPYQLAICFAALFYSFIGLYFLRKLLLRYVDDIVTAVTLVLISLGTNYIQYVSVDSGMTHGYIFTLYALLLLLTVQWHEKPTRMRAFLIGAVIGLGVISRPTEGVMIFIPLLYGLHASVSKKEKWGMVRKYHPHVLIAIIGGLIAIFPQLLYWKIVTGSWIYDVGSKWTFLQPNWQVMFGWEKGWFIYTPVTILMVAGLFFLRKNPFYGSVLIFFLLNTWIIISWDDWRYGASYSTRALVQSYAVMSIPLAFMLQKLFDGKFKILIWIISAFLIYINLFQIWQYNKGILHYNDMNRKYYQAIFLKSNPSPEKMSLIDTDEYIDESDYEIIEKINIDSQFTINASKMSNTILWEKEIDDKIFTGSKNDRWIHVSIDVFTAWGAFDTYLITSFKNGDQPKERKVRMNNGLSRNMEWNTIAYYFRIPEQTQTGKLNISVDTKMQQDFFVRNVSVTILKKNNSER